MEMQCNLSQLRAWPLTHASCWSRRAEARARACVARRAPTQHSTAGELRYAQHSTALDSNVGQPRLMRWTQAAATALVRGGCSAPGQALAPPCPPETAGNGTKRHETARNGTKRQETHLRRDLAHRGAIHPHGDRDGGRQRLHRVPPVAGHDEQVAWHDLTAAAALSIFRMTRIDAI
jgi:hypothetical protein